jgi:AbiV family abortive infection protein
MLAVGLFPDKQRQSLSGMRPTDRLGHTIRGVAKRRIPNRDECFAGILPVLANATAHRDAAEALAEAGQYGFAVAHLVYALEESEKARTLAKVAMGESLTEDEIRRGLYEHKDRHVGALAKSLSSGGAVMDFAAESLRERVGLRTKRTDAQRLAVIDARHPEVLPMDWPDSARATRERNLYVDLRESGWSGPADTAAREFERLRPAVTMLLKYLRAAYEREIVPLINGVR